MTTMKKKEVLQFVEENAELIANEIKSRGKDFQLVLAANGKLVTRHVDDWAMEGAFYFGHYHRLINRMPTLKHKVTPELVIRQTKYDLAGNNNYLSPVDEILEEAYYSEIEK